MISKLLNRIKSAFEPKNHIGKAKPISTVAFIDADGVSKNAEKVVLRLVDKIDKVYVVKTCGGLAQKAERSRLSMMFGAKSEIVIFDAVGKEAVDKIIAMQMTYHMAQGVRRFALISHDADFIDVSVHAKTLYPDVDTTMVVINDGNKEKVQSLVKKCRQRQQKFFIVGMKKTLKKMTDDLVSLNHVEGKLTKNTLVKILSICQPHADESGRLTKAHFKWLMKHHDIYTGTIQPHDVISSLILNKLAYCHENSKFIQFPQFKK